MAGLPATCCPIYAHPGFPPPVVIPVEAGIQASLKAFWISACAGMTDQQVFEKPILNKADTKNKKGRAIFGSAFR
jgi:hypothetical protein